MRAPPWIAVCPIQRLTEKPSCEAGHLTAPDQCCSLNGSTVVREFSRRGVPVRALVRDRSKASGIAGLPHVQVVEGDMSRGETLGPALAAVNRVLMISSSVPQMVDTQCRFIDVSKAAGIAHVVKFSGRESGIGFNAKNFCFTRMHEEIERYLEASGVAWTHLRPSQFMQVYLREAPSIVSKGDRTAVW
jgi:uncharacterized protein YbjT (DUF2867 family)